MSEQEETTRITLEVRSTLAIAMTMAAKHLGLSRKNLLRETMENVFQAEEEAVISLQETLDRSKVDKSSRIVNFPSPA